jgi:hypothetical protein
MSPGLSRYHQHGPSVAGGLGLDRAGSPAGLSVAGSLGLAGAVCVSPEQFGSRRSSFGCRRSSLGLTGVVWVSPSIAGATWVSSE